MPKSTLALKSTVTRQAAAPVPSDLNERLRQLQHHQQATSQPQPDSEQPPSEAPSDLPENAPPVLPSDLPPEPPPTEPSPAPAEKKRSPHELQLKFLSANLGRVVTVFLVNGIKLVGKLRGFDQFSVVLAGIDGTETLIYKHAISTIAPGAVRPPPKGD